MAKEAIREMTLEDFLRWYDRDLLYLEGFAHAVPEPAGAFMRGRLQGMRLNLKALKKAIESLEVDGADPEE